METVNRPDAPSALFIDEYFVLTIRGSARLLNKTVITSRRHCLSKTFGDVTPDTLVAILNAAPTDGTSEDAYTVVGVEVWGYGVADIADLVARLNASHVAVVGIEEYVARLNQHVFNT